MTLANPLNSTQNLTYTNVLGSLVEAEVKLQVKNLPPEIRRLVRPIEVMTYALNRLHPLYACSETGVKAQRQKAMELYGSQITQAVTWGIRAVQQDPLRRFHPLKNEPVSTPQELAALDWVRSWLQDPSITRETLGQRLQSGLQSERIHERHRVQKTVAATTTATVTEPEVEPAEPVVNALSWKDYKNRRSLSERKNLHLLRSTAGAAGSLRLMG